MINVEVKKKDKETIANLLRRFTKSVQNSGTIRKAKTLRFYDRPLTKKAKKEKTLKRIAKQEEREELIKLGKISDNRRF